MDQISSLSVFLHGQKIKEKMDLERIKVEQKMKISKDGEILKIYKELREIIFVHASEKNIDTDFMIGFMLFDSYKKKEKEEKDGKL